MSNVERAYYYAWGNNAKRVTLKGRRCAVLVRGKMNSCLVEFENGQREVVSRNAIRRVRAAEAAALSSNTGNPPCLK